MSGKDQPVLGEETVYHPNLPTSAFIFRFGATQRCRAEPWGFILKQLWPEIDASIDFWILSETCGRRSDIKGLSKVDSCQCPVVLKAGIA